MSWRSLALEPVASPSTSGKRSFWICAVSPAAVLPTPVKSLISTAKIALAGAYLLRDWACPTDIADARRVLASKNRFIKFTPSSVWHGDVKATVHYGFKRKPLSSGTSDTTPIVQPFPLLHINSNPRLIGA